jgi:hypothetical protein
MFSTMGQSVRSSNCTDLVARWPDDRPHRVVLVPMGALALVPWHAAYYRDNGRPHYAVC